MRCYVLADFFNLGLLPGHRPPNPADVSEGVNELVTRALDLTRQREIQLRLYGGWHGSASPPLGAVRPLVARAIRDLQTTVFGRRVFVQIADAPWWDRSMPLHDTVRGIPLRVSRTVWTPSDNCVDPDACSYFSVKSWLEGHCPRDGCAVRLGDIARTVRQKMVDTLLVADAVMIAKVEVDSEIVIASDDDDMIPALLALAACEPVRVVHLTRRSASDDSRYAGTLGQLGVELVRWLPWKS